MLTTLFLVSTASIATAVSVKTANLIQQVGDNNLTKCILDEQDDA